MSDLEVIAIRSARKTLKRDHVIMHRHRKSDSLIISERSVNKICNNKHMAENMERGRLTERNPSKRNKGRITLASELERMRHTAQKDRMKQLISL